MAFAPLTYLFTSSTLLISTATTTRCKANRMLHGNKRKKGRTVFIEQNPTFGQEIARQLQEEVLSSSESEEEECEVVMMTYDTIMTQGLDLLGR